MTHTYIYSIHSAQSCPGLVGVSWMSGLEQKGLVLLSMNYLKNLPFSCLSYMQSRNIVEVSLTSRMSVTILTFYLPAHEAFSFFKNWIFIVYLALFLLQ